jgi:poly(hydroxyalkanoate) depolymerase family esterase
MPGLADTLSRLNELRGRLALPGEQAAPDRLQDVDDFGFNPGALRARTYIPEELPTNPALVVVLHGCTQTAAAYDRSAGWSRLADRDGFIVLFPEQRRANNPNLCFNWFSPQHNHRDQGEALSIAQMIGTVKARYAVDPDRVFVTGLSAGGAMTSVMLATYPELFDGGAIIAGLPYGLASSVPQAFEVMRGQIMPGAETLGSRVLSASEHRGPWPKISVWHGAADRTVDVANATAVLTQWQQVHGTTERPVASSTVSGFSRRVWKGRDGRDAIEEFIIPGMGHGVPLDAMAPDSREVASSFMLDVGISSTQEIARFWGLIDSRAPNSVQHVVEPKPALEPARATGARPLGLEAAGDKGRPAPRAASGVQKIIEDALRSAGLMK